MTSTSIMGRLALFGLWLLACPASAKLEIDAMKHDIQQITASNFDGVIGKFRDTAVSVLWFYKDTKADRDVLEEYNAVAKDLKGMVKVCAINCDDWDVFCNKNNIKQTPSFMIYPTNPVPAFLYEGKVDKKALVGKVARFIPDMSTKLEDKAAADTWLTSDPTKPKVLLFSDKKSPPTILKALSSETVFKRSLKFAFVSKDNDEVVKRFKVTKFPTIIMQRGSKAEVKETYKGDLTFQALKDWVNLHSESGMGDKVAGGGKQEESVEESKPWLVQEVPELTSKSHQDICFRGEGLCVIYLKDGEISTEESDMLSSMSKKFTSQLSDRGAKMKFMWINLAVETEFKTLFNPTQMPSAVVFNPHKRLRFTALDHGEDNDVKGDAAAISNLVDKVLGGDARFKMVPGQKLPSWAMREAKAAGKKSEL